MLLVKFIIKSFNYFILHCQKKPGNTKILHLLIIFDEHNISKNDDGHFF